MEIIPQYPLQFWSSIKMPKFSCLLPIYLAHISCMQTLKICSFVFLHPLIHAVNNPTPSGFRIFGCFSHWSVGFCYPPVNLGSKLNFLTLFQEIYSNLSLNFTTYHCKAELSGWPGETISVGCILYYYKINATCTDIPLVILFALKFYLPREFFFKKKMFIQTKFDRATQEFSSKC